MTRASRADLFATLDQPELRPPPEEPYVFARWKRCRVAPDYHVEVDGSFRSVPFGLIREPARVRVVERTVEVFHRGRRVASHVRSPGRRGHATTTEHMAWARTAASVSGHRPGCWPRPRRWGRPPPPFARR